MHVVFESPAAAAAARLLRRSVMRPRRLRQQAVVHPQDDVALEQADFARRLRQHHLAAERPTMPREGVARRGVDAHHLGRHRTVGARRPGARIADDRHHLRLDQVRLEALERPAAAVRESFLGDLEPPRTQAARRPLLGRFGRGRPGDPRAVHVAQPAHRFHRLRPLEPFRRDRPDHGGVGALGKEGGLGRQDQGGEHDPARAEHEARAGHRHGGEHCSVHRRTERMGAAGAPAPATGTAKAPGGCGLPRRGRRCLGCNRAVGADAEQQCAGDGTHQL